MDDALYGTRDKRGDWKPLKLIQYPPVFGSAAITVEVTPAASLPASEPYHGVPKLCTPPSEVSTR